jgi:hypothetical protein
VSTPKALSQDSPAAAVPDGQLTAENHSIEVGDVSFVYRHLGNERTAAPPLVMLQHFRGNLESGSIDLTPNRPAVLSWRP